MSINRYSKFLTCMYLSIGLNYQRFIGKYRQESGWVRPKLGR